MITFIVGFFFGVVWLGLKAFELTQRPLEVSSSWTHPLSQKKVWLLERPSQCRDLLALEKEIKASSSEKIWFLDVQPHGEDWVVFCPFGSSGELFQRWQEGVSLKKLLPVFENNQRFVIFNIHASQKSEAEGFIELTKSFETSDHIAIVSPSRIPVETIRKERPQWFFGADRTTLTKVQAFHALRLVGLLNPWADFYVITKNDSVNINRSVLEFLNHRNKVLIKEVEKNDIHPLAEDSLYRGVLPTNGDSAN